MTRYSLVLGWCLVLGAVERSPDDVIKQVIEEVATSTGRIPNYTCEENVSRNYYWPTASTLPRSCPVLMEQRRHPTPDMVLRLAVTDRLYLDVAMTGRGEIFSWAGAARFSDGAVDQIVNGPMVTGVFGAFLTVIFKQDVRKFTFEGSRQLGGRTLMGYSFQVPPNRSDYKIHVPDGPSLAVGYSGTALVDPATGDLVLLTVIADELPAAAGACEISTDLALTMVKIGDGEFLLPARARQRYVITNGDETEITTAFSSCREYRGESTVSFTAPDVDASAKQSESTALVRVPARQKFAFELTVPIRSALAAAGDEFVGRLLTPLRDDRRRKLADAGSLVKGRILRVERHHLAPPFTVIVMRPEKVQTAQTEVSLAAGRDYFRELSRGRPAKARTEIPLPLPSERNAGVFKFAGDDVVVPRGYRSYWWTVDGQAR